MSSIVQELAVHTVSARAEHAVKVELPFWQMLHGVQLPGDDPLQPEFHFPSGHEENVESAGESGS